MKLASFDALVKALDDAHVRYLVAGGLAVNAHGLLRFTKDVDLVIQLAPGNIERAFAALGALGYRPIVPVQASQLADRATREGWIREKGMQVLQFWSDGHPETPVDVFVAEPFAFDEEYRRALIKPLGSLEVRFSRVRHSSGSRRRRTAPRTGSTSITCERGWTMATTSKPEISGIDWSLTTWEGARREQMRRWSELPLERIILALEEMEDLAERFAASQDRVREP